MSKTKTISKEEEAIIAGQNKWASENKDNKEDPRHKENNNYFDDYNSNLFNVLNYDAIKSFEEGNGNELKDDIAKMKALVSSSALCVNIFQYFINNKEVTKLLKACGCGEIDYSAGYNLEFEHKKAAIKSPANLDVAILPKSGNRSYFFESKFVEFYRGKKVNKLGKSYYKTNNNLINDFNSFVQDDFKNDFAEKLKNSFHYLDAAQLLKHTFALMKAFKNDTNKFELIYIFFELPNNQITQKHLDEIAYFKEKILKKEINFRYLSYNNLIKQLEDELVKTDENKAYLDYIKKRYIQPYEQQ